MQDWIKLRLIQAIFLMPMIMYMGFIFLVWIIIYPIYWIITWNKYFDLIDVFLDIPLINNLYFND